MAELLTPDICVIGAGSGGLTVAAAAAAFGVPVVLIEKGRMGGDCLNYGCVPSKALIAAAKHADAFRHGAAFGIAAAEPAVDFAKVHDHIHDVIAGIAPHDSVERFTGLGVRVVEDAARFTDSKTVIAGDITVRPRRFVIATGSSPSAPPIPGLDSVGYLTNETIFDLTERPKHLIIIGGGPIGIELAQAHRRLGADVTVLEAFTPLGKDDPEHAAIVLQRVRDDGVVIRDGIKIVNVAETETGIAVILQDDSGDERIEGSHLLVAAGRKPNVDGLGLEEAGIAHDRSGITVDGGLRSTNSAVYAIGDVAGGLQFTHVAGYHAGLVVRSILFRLPAKENRDLIPWATFTDPALAHVGRTDVQARDRYGDAIRVLKWSYEENDRARAERRTEGRIMVVTDKRGRILGVDIVGISAGEIINLWALAIASKLRIKHLTGFVSPYPTLSEISRRAAITYYTPSLSNPWLRRIIRWLRVFG